MSIADIAPIARSHLIGPPSWERPNYQRIKPQLEVDDCAARWQEIE